jgi:hypothetical protein
VIVNGAIDYSRITGKLLFHRQMNDGGAIVYSCEWQGGDVIGITGELLDDIDPALVRREGDLLHFMNTYTVELFEQWNNNGRITYLARRVEVANE